MIFKTGDDDCSVEFVQERIDDIECVVLEQDEIDLIIPRNQFIKFIEFLKECAKVNNIG